MPNPHNEQIPNALFNSAVGKFLAELECQGYSRLIILVYRRSIRALRRVMEDHGVAPDQLTSDIAANLVQSAKCSGDPQQHVIFIVRRFVGWLVSESISPPPAEPTVTEQARELLCRDYQGYLRHQRGVSERSISDYWRGADRFLTFRFGTDEVDFRSITSADIITFAELPPVRKIIHRDTRQQRHLRNFFQYLFRKGLTSTNLALCVPKMARRHDARLPRFLDAEQVEAVLAAVRDNPRLGRRNYAMVLLLARLGLRAPEVIAIQLDDIDWRAGELIVRGKGQWHDRVPIPPDVGEALTDYIRHDRISASRALFVTDNAPHGPFVNGQEINTILKAAFSRCGVKPPCPYVGSHVLRHSLATNLVRQGASLEEVSDILRHRCRVSTLIYAKLDIAGLRSIAQPWPGAGGGK